MTWTAVIPLKGSAERKTRLALRLSDAQRRMLTDQLLRHVTSALDDCAEISDIRLLSDMRPAGWDRPVEPDQGRGLNAELRQLARILKAPLLVILPDLPFLSAQDVSVLLAQAENGCAIAPDRHGLGTNAIALSDPVGFAYSFGADSLKRHIAAAGGQARVVKRYGFGFDVDTLEDLDIAMGLGGLQL